jgi:hypothetical protein
MADLGAYLKSINTTKKNVMRDTETDDPKVISGFPAFLVRRLLSYHMDAIFEANEMNCLPHLDNQLQYEYLLHILPKKNRWSKMQKIVVPETLELVKNYYKFSNEKALEVLALHTEEDFARMRAHLSEGGEFRET